MTQRTDHKLGHTPMLKRTAFHYLQKGLGEHISIDPSYDKVIVKSLYDWTTPVAVTDNDDIPSQGGIVVEFWKDGRRVRWIDFTCRVGGGGGAPIMREV